MGGGQIIFSRTDRPKHFRAGVTTTQPIFAPAVFLFLALCFAFQGLAQSSTRLTGFVFDQNGDPIAHAAVRFIEDAGSRTGHSVSTDETGLFLFENVSSRRGRLIVEALGFRRSTVTLSGADVE